MDIQYRWQLIKLLKHLNLPLVGVCVGVAEANFDRDLLNEGLEKLYSIDNWDTILGQKGDGGETSEWHLANYKEAVKKLSQFGDKSIIIKGMSNEMSIHIPDESVGLVYIDCDHSYEGVKNDIHNYYPKLVKGGIMAFHDFVDNGSYGVIRAVYEFAMENKLEVNIIPENKYEDQGAWFRKK